MLTRSSISPPVPPGWRKEVESVLLTDAQLARRVRALAREIERDYRGREMVVESLRLDFMGVSSYGSGTESGEPVFTKEFRLDAMAQDVLETDEHTTSRGIS